jgi:hypothetical protein
MSGAVGSGVHASECISGINELRNACICRQAPGFKDFVAYLTDSPANPAVLFDADPGNWR